MSKKYVQVSKPASKEVHINASTNNKVVTSQKTKCNNSRFSRYSSCRRGFVSNELSINSKI